MLKELRMDIKQIRRTNLLLLMERERSKAAFARKVGTDPAYISQILSEKTRAEIGDTLARNIEKAYELTHGWMDNFPAAAEEVHLLGVFRALPKDRQLIAIKLVEALR